MEVLKVWEDEFKPKCIDEFVLRPDTREALINIVRGLIGFPAHGMNGILLYGPCGTGKTEMANLLPHLIEYGKTQAVGSVSETDAATTMGLPLDDAGYHKKKLSCRELTYNALLEAVNAQHTGLFRPRSGYCYQILDEVDELQGRQRSLKGLMNDHDKTIFILTTNYDQYIDAGVKDRCIRLNFGPAPTSLWRDELIRELENLGLDSTFWETRPDAIPYLDQEIGKLKGSARQIHAFGNQMLLSIMSDLSEQ